MKETKGGNKNQDFFLPIITQILALQGHLMENIFRKHLKNCHGNSQPSHRIVSCILYQDNIEKNQRIRSSLDFFFLYLFIQLPLITIKPKIPTLALGSLDT